MKRIKERTLYRRFTTIKMTISDLATRSIHHSLVCSSQKTHKKSVISRAEYQIYEHQLQTTAVFFRALQRFQIEFPFTFVLVTSAGDFGVLQLLYFKKK